MAQDTKVRYAVIGAGHIAQVAVLPAFANARENSSLVALVSSDADKRAELAKKFDIKYTGDYSELESVLQRAEVDAVYIATPNSLHREHAERSFASGAHVLCEKPLAPTVEDCQAIQRAAQRSQRYLMVAYRLHFEEATLKAIEIAQSGKLGELRAFDSIFGHVVREGDIRKSNELGGGALLDLGVYCVNAARNLFRAEPIAVSAQVLEREGADDTTSAILRFPDQRIAQFVVSNSFSSISSYRLAGTEGSLRVEPAYEYSEANEHYLTLGDKTDHQTFHRGDQFAPELLHFSSCILQGREPEPSGEEGILDVRVIQALLESARTGQTIKLEPRTRGRRPEPDQLIKKPPVPEQEPVKADAPSVK